MGDSKGGFKVLVVDDEPGHRLMLRANLETEGFQVSEAEDGLKALALLEKEPFDCVLMDVRMPRLGGLEALRELRERFPDLPVIMMTAYASVRSAVECLKAGAEDYLMKPLNVEELLLKVKKVMEVRKLLRENEEFRQRLDEKFGFERIVGNSEAMREVFEIVSMVAPTDATVLVTGESGTGKELVANAIHQRSPRRRRPFVKINCAALPDNLLESELFGHEKGAFTGAVSRREGKFAYADGGTIFLDEITEMSPGTQAKILRVLQEKEFEPLGTNTTVKVDVRVIAATNRNLEEEVENGRFREDLYYRLNVVQIRVPPLRERKDDIPLLADYFLRRNCEKLGKKILGFSREALDALIEYRWPGNVRELENAVERAAILCKGDEITLSLLPDPVRMRREGESEGHAPAIRVGISLREAERRLIIWTLENTGGNRTKAAEMLGISRKTLQNKIKEYGIDL